MSALLFKYCNQLINPPFPCTCKLYPNWVKHPIFEYFHTQHNPSLFVILFEYSTAKDSHMKESFFSVWNQTQISLLIDKLLVYCFTRVHIIFSHFSLGVYVLVNCLSHAKYRCNRSWSEKSTYIWELSTRNSGRDAYCLTSDKSLSANNTDNEKVLGTLTIPQCFQRRLVCVSNSICIPILHNFATIVPVTLLMTEWLIWHLKDTDVCNWQWARRCAGANCLLSGNLPAVWELLGTFICGVVGPYFLYSCNKLWNSFFGACHQSFFHFNRHCSNATDIPQFIFNSVSTTF